MSDVKNICVFCGASPGEDPVYRQAATEFGTLIGQAGLGLVYGGGNVGLMGTIADAVLAAGGPVIGVIPDFLQARELAHYRLTELHLVKSMHERKALMAEKADAFVAMPGGYGTLEEFCEVTTWAQLGLHAKPLGVLNTKGYYDHLLKFLDHGMAEGFIPAMLRELVLTADTPESLLTLIRTVKPQPVNKWAPPAIPGDSEHERLDRT